MYSTDGIISIPAHLKIKNINSYISHKISNIIIDKGNNIIMVDSTDTCITCFTCGETPCALIRDIFEIDNSFSKADKCLGNHKEKRFQSYKQYVKLIFGGQLGNGVRIPLPYCFVQAVRNRYPAPDGIYVGFKK